MRRRLLSAAQSLAWFAVLAFTAWAIITWAATPVVYVDEDGECVEVLSPDTSHSCENMPERYDRIRL